METRTTLVNPVISLSERIVFLLIPVVGLMCIVGLEFLFLEFEIFEYVPYIGILFHLAGGYWIAMFCKHVFYSSITSLPPIVYGLFLLGCVGLAAVAWEVFEFVISWNQDVPMNNSVACVIEDLIVGPLGGVVYVLRTWNNTDKSVR
ncbi:MAG: hypothetical protein U0U66_07685 [Cytophagaceae bacterium]